MDLTKFDAIFQQAATGTTIPWQYLRALAVHESSLNPDAVGPGKEIGLMQIANVTLKSYNQGVDPAKQVTAEQAKDPLVNAQIAVWLISRIKTSFAKNHPQTLKEDWSLERYVGLVTQAYNAGESEKGGVGQLVGQLEKQGISPERITYLTVAQANDVTKANKWLSDKNRLAYVKRVIDDYMKFRAEGDKPASLPEPSIVPTVAVPQTGGSPIKKS